MMTALREQEIVLPEITAPAGNEAVLVLVSRRMRLLVGLRVSWLQFTWSQRINDPSRHGAAGTGNDAVDSYLLEVDDPLAEAEWIRNNPSLQERLKALAEIEGLLKQEHVSRLSALRTVFRLGDVETDIVQCCLCLSVEPSLAPAFGYLNDNETRRFTSLELVSRLFGHPMPDVLAASTALGNWAFIRTNETGSGDTTALQLDAYVQHWLLGEAVLDPVLQPVSQAIPVFDALKHWPVKETLASISRMIVPGQPIALRLIISGIEGSGRKSFAALICHELGLTALALDTDRIPENHWPQQYLHAQRQAFLDRRVPLWTGAAVLERIFLTGIHSFNLQVIIADEGTSLRPQSPFVDMTVAPGPLPVADAPAVWVKMVPGAGSWPADELEGFCRRQQATIGQISGAARKGVPDIPAAASYVKESIRRHLGQLAQPLSGKFTWEDLIVEPGLQRHLEDLCFEAGDRPLFWEQESTRRQFPQGRGLVALFSGSPGTGKTMAAQVLANQLQLDIYRVDLAAIVSKYVGETSKNLNRILNQARALDMVLLFDEADALFGKRTEIKDAHDRFANTDTNYLLQAIEEYPGIVLLATNKKGNIDAGFLRRLRYVLEFPKPGIPQRYQLWKRMLDQLTAAQPAAVAAEDLARISELLEVTGAQVKMSILTALFMSRRLREPVSVHHLLCGIEREYLKEGRGLGRHIIELFNYTSYGRNS